MSGAGKRVVVIGGGVIGAATAYYLSLDGWHVCVIDRHQFGQACSHGNCGFVCPSHALPLAEPGAVSKTFKAMLRPNSPFSIKLRFDPDLWRWLFRFMGRCNKQDMLEAARARHGLLQSSMDLYRQLLNREKIDCEWEERGLLLAFQTRRAMDHYASTDELLREHFQLGARRYEGDKVTDLEPALQHGLAGGWHYEQDTHLRPDKLMSGWRSALQQRGVEIRDGCQFEEFVREGQYARAINTTQGELAADQFVFATGAMTPQWNTALGCQVPIQPGKGYSITMARPACCPRIPIIFAEHKVAATPLRSGYRLGSTMQFAGYDTTIDPRRLNLLTAGAGLYLREPVCEPVEETWFGWRPMTYDGLPIIDRTPLIRNAWIAAGHNMVGLSMGPATGRLVAELIGGRPTHVDPEPFSLARFR